MPAVPPSRNTLRRRIGAWLRFGRVRIPIVRLQGAIGRTGPFTRGMTLEGVAPLLARAFADVHAPAVAIIVNSPGGSPVQSHLIHRRIRALAEQTGKPVLAFVEDAAASGGYMIACAADEIIVDPSSIVGSIGVVTGGFGFAEAIGRIGVERRLYTAGESKAMLDPFLPENPDQVARLKALQEEIHAHFIVLVRARRGERLRENGENLFSGAFWAGKKALALGLADGLGEVNAVLRARYGEKVKLQPVAGRKGFGLGRLLGAAAATAPATLLDLAEERGHWSRLGL